MSRCHHGNKPIRAEERIMLIRTLAETCRIGKFLSIINKEKRKPNGQTWPLTCRQSEYEEVLRSSPTSYWSSSLQVLTLIPAKRDTTRRGRRGLRVLRTLTVLNRSTEMIWASWPKTEIYRVHICINPTSTCNTSAPFTKSGQPSPDPHTRMEVKKHLHGWIIK